MSDVRAQEQVASPAAPALLMSSVVSVTLTEGPDKLVWLPAEKDAVPMGMHDELAVHYGAPEGSYLPRASTLDYVVGAVAACLAGTFRRALTARGVRPALDALEVQAIGEIVLDEGVPVIRSIEVHYRLGGTAADEHERVQRAHAVHHRACAVSRSVEAAIAIRTELELV